MSETPGTASAEDGLLAERYELGELVGRGGMAEVYRAHDRLLERTVAVKVFGTHADHAPYRRFDDEAHALARLEHSALVSIFDVRVFDNRPCLVMEFIDGTSLQSRLLTGPLPPDQVIRIGSVLADALAHAHGRGVVHRDVKPSNIMLDHDDLPHLTDFGIALLAGTPRLTCANEIVGTPAYLAPEQLSDGEVGPPADVYALALVLLECLTGEAEYPSGTNLEVALTRLHRPPRIPAGLSPTFTDLLTAMTSTEPRHRPTAQRCARQLLAPLAETATAAIPRRSATAPGGGSDLWWADQDRTVREPITVPEPAAATAMPGWRRLTASFAGIAVVIVALVFLLNSPRPPTQHAPTGAAAGHAHTGTSDRPGSPGVGSGATGGTGVAGTLVEKEHSFQTTAPTTPPTTPPTSPETPTTPSSTATSTAPPTMTSSEAPTTSDSTPPSTSSTPDNGTSN